LIKTGGHLSEIYVGEKWENFRNCLPARNTLIITDHNVRSIYGSRFGDFPVLSVEPGESSKRLETIEMLVTGMLELGADRSWFILAIGGGVVCDIAGFLASVYMRGLPFGFISSTMLSQVDASVGGKNGVNSGTIKNIIGTFNQPDFVICDPSLLSTLEKDEYLSGLSELIKMGLILDKPLLESVMENRDKIMARDTGVLKSLIARSVKLKAKVVTEDEKEAGKRMILNFGHTFGHAIEAASGQKHGLAVASGMLIACRISVQQGLLQAKDHAWITDIIRYFNLIRPFDLNPSILPEIISRDKKKAGKEINFVLLEKPGKAVIKKINLSELSEYHNYLNGWQ
jgi:3-dehydroquinate synthase